MLGLYTIWALATTRIIPSIVAIAGYRNLPSSAKPIAWLMIIGLVNEMLMIAVALLKMNNLFTIHIWAILEIILLSAYFYRQIRNSNVQKIVIVVMTALAAFAVVHTISGNNIGQFNSIPRAIESVYFSILGYWLFFEMADGSRPINDGEYFINGAIVFYFSSCFLIFAFSKYFAADQNVVMMMFSAHSMINALCNLAFAAGLWIISKRYYTQA